ncbi:MAG: TIGR03960 family B12-binding radical SAM protein [Treponema sp.]|nr:TIGR03960 family B12-binding radical SAM protein [Treponema sp.]
MKTHNILLELGRELNYIQSPSRYLGGELGSIIKPHTESDEYFNFAIAFPDIYEIAMSNLAVKIIYNALNKIPSVRCERVFSPETDFEKLLKEKNIPLCTLETGMPLCDVDMIGFSIGYELGITQVLAMLDMAGVPVVNSERTEKDPLVFAGGCGVTNPAPFSLFFDAVFIGEAEDELFKLVEDLAALKKKEASRKELIDFMKQKTFIWTPDKEEKVFRAVQGNFGLVPSVEAFFPLPINKPVQDHGVVEIMRGCPNGCRFCHAGVYYRPMRVKNIRHIINEVDSLVFDCGYNQISLNSLSSADFPDVGGLLDLLNKRYEGYNVSFQLPSLKVNSMSLDILEKISRVRKSGLTFAIETPEEMWQLSLNKEVYAQHLEEVIKEAKKRGWSSAKFYFMIGLPLGDYFSKTGTQTDESEPVKTEEGVITEFLLDIQARTKIQCNVNVGIFIPKPHTAYQWVRQITPEEAQRKLEYIANALPRGKFKVSRHNYDATVLEGLMSRGNREASKVILDAYRMGARFDAWDDHLRENVQIWNRAFENASFNVKEYIYREWDTEEPLPWDNVSLGIPKAFFKKEWEKSIKSELSPRCSPNCNHKCGICNTKDIKVHTKETVESLTDSIKINTVDSPAVHPECNIRILYRVVFSFERSKGSEFIPYLSQLELFYKAVLISRLPFVFSGGFNPLPRLEFASPLTVGVVSEDEIASCCLYDDISAEEFIRSMNRSLPDSFRIKKAFIFPVTNLRKRESLSSSLWGAEYLYEFDRNETLKTLVNSDSFAQLVKKYTLKNEKNILFDVQSSDKKVRALLEELTGKKWYELVKITKTKTLANSRVTGWTAEDEEAWRTKSEKKSDVQENETPENETCSFFELYEKIKNINAELIIKREELTLLQAQLTGKIKDQS